VFGAGRVIRPGGKGLSDTDAMREMIRDWTGEPDATEPAPRVLRGAGSAVDAVGLDRPG